MIARDGTLARGATCENAQTAAAPANDDGVEACAEDLRYTAGPAGPGECRVALEGGLVLLYPEPPVRPGSCQCGLLLVLVAELDVRLARDPSEPGAWFVTRLDDGVRPGRLLGVPEPAPWTTSTPAP